MTVADSYALRTLLPEDLETVLAWRNHPSVRRFMFDAAMITPEQHRAWFNRVSADADRELLLYSEHGVSMGFMQFAREMGHQRVEWGFYTAPESLRGTGSRMCRHALARLFAVPDVHKLTGRVLDFNQASRHLHQRLGFTEEACLREHHFDGSQWRSVYAYGLLRDEWLMGSTEEARLP